MFWFLSLLLVLELHARTIFTIRYYYIYVVHILLVIMPETASAPSSTRNRPTKRYQCSICNKSFDSAETFDSHQRFEHSEPGHSKPLAGVGWYTRRIRTIDIIRSTNSNPNRKRHNTSTKMAFGYNDLIWILSVITWTIGVTAIIMYIIKRRRRTTTGTS